MSPAELRRLLATSLDELDLARRVHDALPSHSRTLPVRVVAIGKGAPAMASGAIARLGAAIERCLVVTADATDTSELLRAAKRARITDCLEVHFAAHPLPDARSVRAAEACLDMVATEEKRSIVVLVSGGASSLVCAPSAGVTLRTKRAITRAMLASGAAVQELNVVRKCLSRIKGGRLAVAAAPNDVLTIVASDVIGGTAADVGSGPSVALTSAAGVPAARRLLRRLAPSFVDVPLGEPRTRARMRTREEIVASPEELARVCARRLRERGIDVRLLPPSQASALELAEQYAALARRSLRRAFVRAAEPSVVVLPSSGRAGRGGRSTHLAALVGRELAGLAGRVLFAALASDGVDGRSGCGGAIIDERFAAQVARRLGPLALDRAIARFDTGSLLRAMGAAAPAHPTGHNLADIHILLVR